MVSPPSGENEKILKNISIVSVLNTVEIRDIFTHGSPKCTKLPILTQHTINLDKIATNGKFPDDINSSTESINLSHISLPSCLSTASHVDESSTPQQLEL